MGKTGEIQMRKVALLAAIALPALFANTSLSIAAGENDIYELNKNTFMFLQGPGAPVAAAPAEPAAVKVAKKKKAKKS